MKRTFALFGVVGLAVIRFARRELGVSWVSGWLVLITPLFAAGAIGCAGPRTPAPPAPITDPTDPAQRSAVLAYARGLTFAFDTTYGGMRDRADTSHADPYGPGASYHGQFDRNLLNTFGDTGIIAPEVNIHRTREGDLRRGRIQLRIEIIPGPGRSAAEVYASLGLYPGTSYVWVDQRDPVRGTARQVIVAADTIAPADTITIRVIRGERWNQPVARWTPAQCWSCEVAGWCHN